MKLQEQIYRIKSMMGLINEVRVPRDERVELYKDDNIIVVVPLTHRALQKYAHRCLWCINDDLGEWEDYHKGKHAVIIQRNPKKVNVGVTNNPTPSEIFVISKWDNNESSFEDVCKMLDYEFRNDRIMSNYYVNLSNDINNFGIDIVYYSPTNGIYDMEDNFLWNFNYEITDIPNVTPEVIEIMDDYLQSEESELNEKWSEKYKKSMMGLLSEEYEQEHQERKNLIRRAIDKASEWTGKPEQMYQNIEQAEDREDLAYEKAQNKGVVRVYSSIRLENLNKFGVSFRDEEISVSTDDSKSLFGDNDVNVVISGKGPLMSCYDRDVSTNKIDDSNDRKLPITPLNPKKSKWDECLVKYKDIDWDVIFYNPGKFSEKVVKYLVKDKGLTPISIWDENIPQVIKNSRFLFK